MNTKKFVLPLAVVIVVLAIVLVACGAKSNTSTTGGSGNVAAVGTPGARNLNQPLPLAEQYIIGTFKLEGTSNAVDAKTATALIPLWQAYAQLTTSNTAAQAEIDAVVTQIQQTMTPQQVQAITAMKLTRQDMFTTMSTLGLTNFQRGANGTPGFVRTPGAGGGFAGGGFPGGGNDGGGGGFGGGFGSGGAGVGGTTGTRPTANPTQIALRAQFANRIPSNLMNALISLLQKKAGS
jgi:hypothetical protein